MRLSKSERYTQIFQQPAYRQLLYLCFLNSWWRIPQVSHVSICLCFATIIIIIFYRYRVGISCTSDETKIDSVQKTLGIFDSLIRKETLRANVKGKWWVTGTAWLPDEDDMPSMPSSPPIASFSGDRGTKQGVSTIVGCNWHPYPWPLNSGVLFWVVNELVMICHIMIPFFVDVFFFAADLVESCCITLKTS